MVRVKKKGTSEVNTLELEKLLVALSGKNRG